MKLNLNHDTEIFREAFGISKERDNELRDMVTEAVVEAACGTPTAKALEKVLKEAKNDNELAYIAFRFGYLHTYIQGPVIALPVP